MERIALSTLVLLAACGGGSPRAAEPTPSHDEGPSRTWTVAGQAFHAAETTHDEHGCTCTLTSAVGPIVSRSCVHDYEADNGGYTTQHVATERLDGAHFSLVDHLASSGQTGSFVAQLVTGQDLGLQSDALGGSTDRCPPEAELRASTETLAALAARLSAAGCRGAWAGASHEAWQDVATHVERFWVADWDGSLVTLAVEIDACMDDRSACAGGYVLVRVTPPADWIPWLDAAVAGEGLLAARVAG